MTQQATTTQRFYPEQAKFGLGQVVTTRGVAAFLEQQGNDNQTLFRLLQRHVSGDWGEVCATDKKSNNDALETGQRLLSAYDLFGRKVWVITEWDRSVTTVLFPEEY